MTYVGKMKIMDKMGHTTIEYEVGSREAETAQKTFKEKQSGGYTPFVYDEETGAYQRAKTFDAAREYLLTPPVVGG